MVVREVFEVLYSPVNAFKKIIEKPDFKGVLLVLLLVIASAVAVEYVASSKRLLENKVPKNDEWTEAITNQHIWTSNGSPLLDATDYQIGNTEGNHSVASSVTGTNIWVKISDIGSINCTEKGGFIEIFFWIKLTNEPGASTSLGTLKLFSGSEDSFFESDITDLLALSGEWTNMTLNVGHDKGWTSTNSPDWQEITGIELSVVFSDSSNLTMKIDGLLFRNFTTTIESGTFSTQIVSVIIQAAMTWILWGGILIIVARLFKEDLGQWNLFFIIIGYIFMATFVFNMITLASSSTLPNLHYLLDATGMYYYPRNPELWLSNVAYQLLIPLIWIGYVWTTALSATAIRVMKDVTWGRAIAISVVAFAVRFILNIFFGF